VRVAYSGSQGLKEMADTQPDVAIIDVMLPDIDGFELCRRLRARYPHLQILLLTARNAVIDKIEGLDSGADDYITKPFDFDELLARIRAALRRSEELPPEPEQLTVGDLVIEPSSHRVWRAGRQIELTRREYDLLVLLARHPNQVLTHGVILQRVWGDDLDIVPEVLKVYIHALRRKLNADGESDPIHALRGVGYTLRP
jgi:two-component system response regulator MprA